MRIYIFSILILISGCKKKGCIDPSADNYIPNAEKNDGTCIYSGLDLPTTYSFVNKNGNSTVNYTVQTDRLKQLTEISEYLRSGNSNVLNVNVLNDMVSNVNENGNGNFSFSSPSQLRDRYLFTDINLMTGYFDSIAIASSDYDLLAINGFSGTINNSDATATYLLSSQGIEYAEIIEISFMSAVFTYQATQVNLGDDKMNADNAEIVDSLNNEYYTELEHNWDKAFGYFGIPENFPAIITNTKFWGFYCNKVNSSLGCNSLIMNHFKRGRAAITANKLAIRDNEIESILILWEKIAARNALEYIREAIDYHDSKTGEYFHALSKGYAFILSLNYFPTKTRAISLSEIQDLIKNDIGTNFWNTSKLSLEEVEETLNDTYDF